MQLVTPDHQNLPAILSFTDRAQSVESIFCHAQKQKLSLKHPNLSIAFVITDYLVLLYYKNSNPVRIHSMSMKIHIIIVY